jgi:hypothetical protein
MLWDFDCEVSAKDIPGHSAHRKVPLVSRYTLSLQLNRESKNANILANSWKLQDKRELEGLLGLWLCSLKSDPAVEKNRSAESPQGIQSDRHPDATYSCHRSENCRNGSEDMAW